MSNHEKIKRMCTIAIFAALSLVLYIVGPKFNLPFFPSFLEINFSMLPILILAFMNGPIDGLLVVGIRFLVKLPFTHTSAVGELSDLVIGLIVVGCCSFAEKKIKGKGKIPLLYGVGVLSWLVAGYISNSFSIPFYINVMGKEAIVGACSMIPGVTEANLISYYYLFGLTPFNLFLSIIVVGITVLVHKRLKNLYDKI